MFKLMDKKIITILCKTRIVRVSDYSPAAALFMQLKGQVPKILSRKTLSRNKILTSIKGHDIVQNKQKITGNNSNLDLVNMNAYIKFGEFLSICSQDIEQK